MLGNGDRDCIEAWYVFGVVDIRPIVRSGEIKAKPDSRLVLEGKDSEGVFMFFNQEKNGAGMVGDASFLEKEAMLVFFIHGAFDFPPG